MDLTTNFNSTKNRLLFISCLLFSFFLKGAILCWIIIGLLVVFKKDERNNVRLLFDNEKYLLLLPFLYLLHVIGVIWTKNYAQAGLDLQIKLTLLLLPVIFSGFSIDNTFLNNVRRYFAGGVFITCLYLLVMAFKNYYLYKDYSVFFYMNFSSEIMHPAYLCLYVNTALIFTLYEITFNKIQSRIFYLTLLSVLFFMFIILLNSRMAVITSYLSFILFWLIFRNTIKRKKKQIFFFVIFAFAIVFQKISINYNNRFQEINYTLLNINESKISGLNNTQIRLDIWKDAIELIKSNWAIGVGTGDIIDTLKSSYQKHGNYFAFINSFNAHNQYLQLTLGLGVLAIVIFLLIFLIPWIYHNSYNKLLLIILFVFALNCLTESMIEAQRGAIFFALMISIFGRKIRSTRKLSH
jgi:O-antigen ligase